MMFRIFPDRTRSWAPSSAWMQNREVKETESKTDFQALTSYSNPWHVSSNTSITLSRTAS
jgi:hypothetical protein